MKKLVDLKLLVYYNMDEVNFEDLEPVKVFTTWEDLDLWMENKYSEAYTTVTYAEIYDLEEQFLAEALA